MITQVLATIAIYCLVKITISGIVAGYLENPDYYKDYKDEDFRKVNAAFDAVTVVVSILILIGIGLAKL